MGTTPIYMAFFDKRSRININLFLLTYRQHGEKGSWLVLAEWVYNDIEEKYIPVCVKAAQIDGAVIKEDTFYKLENGEFKEA